MRLHTDKMTELSSFRFYCLGVIKMAKSLTPRNVACSSKQLFFPYQTVFLKNDSLIIAFTHRYIYRIRPHLIKYPLLLNAPNFLRLVCRIVPNGTFKRRNSRAKHQGCTSPTSSSVTTSSGQFVVRAITLHSLLFHAISHRFQWLYGA